MPTLIYDNNFPKCLFFYLIFCITLHYVIYKYYTTLIYYMMKYIIVYKVILYYII